MFGAAQFYSCGRQTYALADFFQQNSILNNFSVFFQVMLVFGVVEPLTECFFCFWTAEFFNSISLLSPELHSGGGDRYICSQTFFDEIYFQIIFILSFFQVMRIFGSAERLNESTISIIGAPSSTLRGDRHKCSQTFLDKIYFQIIFILFFSGDAYFWQRSAFQ